MTIKRKAEIDRLNFISKGGAVSSDKKEKGEFRDVLLRVPNFILEHIAQDIEKRPWLNRTQWILDAVAEKIEASKTHE